MGGLDPNSDQPWLANKPRQWWRIPLSIIYHHGVIHVVVVCIMEFLIMRVMEKSVGWLRIMLVYVLSGIGGILVRTLYLSFNVLTSTSLIHILSSNLLEGFYIQMIMNLTVLHYLLLTVNHHCKLKMV